MKYDHVVKYNGQYYAAGEDVPNDKSIPKKLIEDEEMGLPFSDPDIEFETVEHKYTYEELERMTAKEMRKLAEDKGFRLNKSTKDDLINEFLSKQ